MRVPQSNRTVEGAWDANQWLAENPEIPSQLRNILSDYYENQGRDFPWRRTKDPYKILIAEILLQKTGVKPVEKVWNVFIQHYPDIKALSTASIQDISSIIGVLGLQKRAKLLHEIAQRIFNEAGGEIIADAKFLESLPGVGKYSTAAVLSFAFDIGLPTLDVNAARVYCRVGGFSPNTLRQGLAFANVFSKQVNTAETHRKVNYGLLDLAAQICKPKPLCDICPARRICCFANT